MKTKRLTHLLIPKKFRVWCRPRAVPGDFDLTTKASACTCAVCLTCYRAKTKGIKRPFRVSHVHEKRFPKVKAGVETDFTGLPMNPFDGDNYE